MVERNVEISKMSKCFEKLKGKRYLVFKYIIQNMNSANQLTITTKELAKAINISEPTVLIALKLLREAGIIETRTGVITFTSPLKKYA